MSRPTTEIDSNENGDRHVRNAASRDDGLRSSGERESLCDAGRGKRFLAGEVIYREGEHVDRIYVIRSGLVKLLSYLANGRARIVRLHADDHWIGLEGLVGESYAHTAIAVDDVEVRQVAIRSVQRLNRNNPGLLGQLLRQWHGALVHADRWIAEFSTGGIKPRVARLLEYLAEFKYGRPLEKVELLTVCEMAEILGVTQESVSRTLATFKRAAILRRQPDPVREIYRLDAPRLQCEALK
jgi:CRP/FNR family transcriptional regulator